MLRFQWNALRVGDKVFVHDSHDVEMRLLPGVVSMVDTTGGANDLAIRVKRGAGPVIVRPSRMTVHLDPLGRTRSCWRCQENEKRAQPPSA